MADYEVAVIGGGTGNNVAAAAADAALETALVEPGPLGGTCLNRGCNPSKILIQRATVANTVREAGRFGVDATLEGIDFPGIVDEMRTTLSGIAEGMEARYREREHLTLYDSTARFVDDRTIEVDGETITADRMVVAAGSRPVIPPIDGLAEASHLTSAEALYLEELPERMVILGGGYIAVELGYFFESMGTDVAIVEMLETLVPREDGAVAEAFTEIAERRHDVYTGHRVTSVSEDAHGITVHAETEAGETRTITGDELLVAVGRRPNTDTLAVETGGIETDDRGFVETNEYLETTAENVWAQGDIAGNFLFKHSGDYETRTTVANVVEDARRPIDFSAMPHVIFTEPQIAGVGATEDELVDAGREYHVGTARFSDSAMGRAKKLEEGFVKVLAAPDGELLGCQVIGHEASTLIHEAVIAMRAGVDAGTVGETIHAHPTLSRVIESAVRDLPMLEG